MTDVFSKEDRSRVMRSVKSRNNSSTEIKLISLMKSSEIKGWRRNYKLIGKPDFTFLNEKLVVFVDGCFWHGHNCRNLKPASNKSYWKAKIDRNIFRDRQVTKELKKKGWGVVRIWECFLNDKKKVNNVTRRLKKALLFALVAFFLASCSKEEKKLEVFSPEAFAYSMEPGWELNASARIKGYDQKEINGTFETDIDYWVDLVKADGDTVKNVFKGDLKDKNPEAQPDIQMNAQIELDSTYAPGSYSLNFRAVDNLSGKKTSAAAKFDLSEE